MSSSVFDQIYSNPPKMGTFEIIIFIIILSSFYSDMITYMHILQWPFWLTSADYLA